VSEPIPWQDLTPTAKAALLKLAQQCADRFTGTVEIELVQGGVAEYRETVRRNAKQLAREALDSTTG